MSKTVVLSGSVGAAKFLRGLAQIRPPDSITAIINVADDFRLHGLAISPDIDTVTYTLAEQVNPETGWGQKGESWRVMSELERYKGQTWFSLGDLDLALHLYRTQRLSEGATLDKVTKEVSAAWDIKVNLLPVPAARMLSELGHEPSTFGVAALYQSFSSALLIDTADKHLSPKISNLDIRAVVANTVMSDISKAAQVALSAINAINPPLTEA